MSTPTAQTNDRLALLYHISQALNSSLDLQDVLDRVMDEVLAATRAERGCVMLLQSDGNLEFHALRGIERQTIDSPQFQIARGIIEDVAREGQAVLTSDAQHDLSASVSESVAGPGLRSILCVPLQLKGATMGAIYVDKRLPGGVFVPDDRELLTAIASSAAIAIENARLYGDLQHNVQELALLQQITQELTSTLDLEGVLTQILERVRAVLGAETSSILMVDGDELVFTVALGAQAAKVKPFRVPITVGIAGWVVRNARGTFTNHVQSDPRFYSGIDKKSGFTTTMLMAAPLTVNDRVIGVLEVSNKPGGFSDKDLNLLSTIASSAGIAIENARLYQVAVEEGRMERELQVARQVQESLIPHTTPHLEGWEFAAHWQPARETSGDYYDFIRRDEQHLGIVIADVSDKGMAAALFMGLTRSTVRGSMAHIHSLGEGIAQANNLIARDAMNGMFVTLCYMEFHSRTGEISYVNAGHNPPLICRAAQDELREFARNGMALGVFEENRFTQSSIQLAPADFIFAYTDGVTDARNARGEDFGEERLKSLVLENKTKAPEDICGAIRGALNDFIGAVSQADDITFVIAKRV